MWYIFSMPLHLTAGYSHMPYVEAINNEQSRIGKNWATWLMRPK